VTWAKHWRAVASLCQNEPRLPASLSRIYRAIAAIEFGGAGRLSSPKRLRFALNSIPWPELYFAAGTLKPHAQHYHDNGAEQVADLLDEIVRLIERVADDEKKAFIVNNSPEEAHRMLDEFEKQTQDLEELAAQVSSR